MKLENMSRGLGLQTDERSARMARHHCGIAYRDCNGDNYFDGQLFRGIAMPIECTFTLNKANRSTLYCPGLGNVAAFSGNGQYINDPTADGLVDKGPIPVGTYYIVDRRSGGHLGWLYDAIKDVSLDTHRAKWFALYRNDEKIDDWTTVHGIRRGNFRLHPVGRIGQSDGCITLTSPAQFDKLRAFLKAQPTFIVPGTSVRAYGKVIVR